MNPKHTHRLFVAITATAWAMLLAGVCYGNLSAQTAAPGSDPSTLPLMAFGMALGVLAWRGRQS